MTTNYRFGNAEVQPARRVLRVNGKNCAVGARAFDLLLALIERRERVVMKNELLDLVWPNVAVEENNLQVHISGLRKLLGAAAIATVPGRGYRFAAELDGIAAPSTPAVAAPTPQHAAGAAGNLPLTPPPLYGRTEELAAIRRLTLEHRLLTLTGAGGIGKTTLAAALAHTVRDAFADGVWLVELAPLADVARVASRIAAALHIVLDQAATAQALAHTLRAGRMLLVLDNCEHLIDAVAAVSTAIRDHAPGVHLVVTSREVLRVPQEQVYRLGGLALPDALDLESARHAGAIALFEARARAADPRFRLDERNFAAAIEICRGLDGMALAIELAAARVPLLGIEGLRQRLDERFDVLTGGSRMALPRHQTLGATLEWSHRLLTTDEQAVFRRLGAFVGSFSIEGAQRVAAFAGIEPCGVIELLGSLVDKSLVAADSAVIPRYHLLETTRAYALEMLQRADEMQTTLHRHAHAMLACFESALREEHRQAAQVRLDRYVPDLDNMRAALDWSAGVGTDPSLHVGLAGAVAWLWIDAGLRPEGLRRTEAAMQRIDAATSPAWEARLLVHWSWLAHPEIGPRELAANARAVQLCRALDDAAALFAALCNQVRFQTYCGQHAQAEQNLQEAESLFRPNWPPGLHIELLNTRGWLRWIQGRHDEALAGYQAMLDAATSWGDQRAVVSALINLEQVAAASGRLEDSAARGRELVKRLRDEPSLRAGNEHFATTNLAMSLTRLGRVDEALEVSRAAFPLCEKAGRLTDLLEQSALLAFKRGLIEDAARVFGCADRTYATTHSVRDLVEQQQRAELEKRLRGALPPSVLADLIREGETLDVESAIRAAYA